MTGDDLLLLRELKGRVQQLFSLVDVLDKEKEQLKLANQSLKQEIDNLVLEKENLRKDLENLKFSKIIESGYSDSKEANKRINSLLREIDKCIALLNR